MSEPEGKQERSDIDVRSIFKFAIALIAVAVIVQVLMWVMFRQLDQRQARRDPQLSPLASKTRRLPEEPRLQRTPVPDLNAIRKLEHDTLYSYGWIDEKNGVVRIPIDVAMKLITEREGITTKTQSHEGEGTK